LISAAWNDPGVTITIIIGAIGGSWAILGLAIRWWNRFRFKGVRVYQLRSIDDDDFDQVLELYQRRIDQSQQISQELIRDWFNDKQLRQKLHITFLVAKHAGEVIGFLQLMWTDEAPYVCVTYFATNEEKYEGRAVAARILTWKLLWLVHSRCKGKTAIVFEVEDTPPQTDLKLARRDRARQRRFRMLFAQYGYRAAGLNASYYQPEMPNDGLTTNLHRAKLMYVPLLDDAAQTIPGSEFCSILNFLYRDVYQHVYRDDPELNEIYAGELEKLLSECSTGCPTAVALV
jgi:hypothetical protein